MKKEPSGAEKLFGGFAPKLVELTDNVLFGDMWERTELSKRSTRRAPVCWFRAIHLSSRPCNWLPMPRDRR